MNDPPTSEQVAEDFQHLVDLIPDAEMPMMGMRIVWTLAAEGGRQMRWQFHGENSRQYMIAGLIEATHKLMHEEEDDTAG